MPALGTVDENGSGSPITPPAGGPLIPLSPPPPPPLPPPPPAPFSAGPGPGSGSASAPPSDLVVFSGGSAANALVDVFEHVRRANRSRLRYVIPISDNGGSSSEIIRVFGGPGIGDVRSRLVRLIPEAGGGEGEGAGSGAGAETAAVRRLFNHRLPRDSAAARDQWAAILEAAHPLWDGVSSPKRELIRAHLNHFNLEAVKRIRPRSRFDFGGASVGNLFLTGARLFTGSLESAVYLLAAVCGVPEHTAVIPVLNSNFAHHIAAGLADGTVIAGQNDISHPSAPTAASPVPDASLYGFGGGGGGDHDDAEDANLPGTLAVLRRAAVTFSKAGPGAGAEDLPARIERLWYINPYGQEIRIPANPRVIEAIARSGTVIYSVGSLFTSLIPSLVLRGVGEAIAARTVRHRVLILNGTHDRESGPRADPLTGLDFVGAIARACADSRGLPPPGEDEFCRYVTHVVYLQAGGPLSPVVDPRRLARLGIESLRLYAREEGRYDEAALTQALEAIIGRKSGMERRRHTFLA